MSTIDTFLRIYQFNRQRTLDFLSGIETEANPGEILGWRPGSARAHIAWQLMHIGITEEVFATARLAPHKVGAWQDLWPRFRGGSTPDDDIPQPALIRQILDASREHLTATLRDYADDRLEEIPATLADRGWSVRTALTVLAWHEPHHQGQAHITLNLYRAARHAA